MALMPPIRHAGRSASSSGSSSCTSLEEGAETRRPLRPRLLRAWLTERRLPAYRFEQVCRWVYARGASSFEEMTDVGRDLRLALARDFTLTRLPVAAVSSSRDGTRKLLFRLDDGSTIETVWIPDPPRRTVCLSSQAGCAMGCEFCATARLGLWRNLGAVELIGQLLALQATLGEQGRCTNVVFMGMGEPLANYDSLLEGIEILTAGWGFGLSGRRITVSTVGLLPQLERLVRETTVNVAVSLTATTDDLRDRLMPVNRRYPLQALLETCRGLPIAQRRRITFEYVLLAGVNDTEDDAIRLVRLLHGIRAKVNLIPFNGFPGAEFRAPSAVAVRSFQEELLRRGIAATLRAHRGRDIEAACGQLAGRESAGRLA